MFDDNDDDRLYASCINPINISLALSFWMVLIGIGILVYKLAAL